MSPTINTILPQDYGLKEMTSMENLLLPKKYSRIFILSIKMKRWLRKTAPLLIAECLLSIPVNTQKSWRDL